MKTKWLSGGFSGNLEFVRLKGKEVKTMPFYNWDNVEVQAISDRVSRQIITGEDVMMTMYKAKAGAEADPHQHEYEQIFCVLSGAWRFRVGDEERVVRAGDVVHIPSNVDHAGRVLEDVVTIGVVKRMAIKTHMT